MAGRCNVTLTVTAVTPRSCARLVGLAGILLIWVGRLSAQPSTEVVADPKSSTPNEPIVVLAPFVVSGEKRPWLYASLPKFEILTRASEERTHNLLLCYVRSWLVENAVIPKEWLRDSPIPYTMIIDDTDPQGPAPSMVPALTKTENYDAFGWSFRERRFTPSMVDKYSTPLTGWIHATDDDTAVLGANLYGDIFMVTAPTRLDRLDRYVPGLPRWMVAGLAGRFGLFADRTNPVVAFIVSTRTEWTAPRDVAIFRGIRWISTAETKRLGRNLGTAEVPFIPLQEFFSESPPPPEQRALWESEAGLLVRWGLLGTNGRVSSERRAQFVKFVERQRSEPVTEKMLIECFGYGYAAMERELKAYLRKTLGMEIQFKMDNVPVEVRKAVAFSPATPDQVGRIIGDWQRMQGMSLRNSQPTQAKAFFDAADQTLRRAWLRDPQLVLGPSSEAMAGKGDLATALSASQISAAGIPNPDFLAVCGLYEYEIGEYKLARDLLEIAVSSHTTRPQAYLLLAELRFREAVAQPEGKNGDLSIAQATYVLQVLKPALPPASSSRPWRLMVDTLTRCESTPSAANLDMIVKGTAQCPRDASLQLDTARLCLKAGERERAIEVIDKAFPLAVDEKVRSEFQQLRDSIRK